MARRPKTDPGGAAIPSIEEAERYAFSEQEQRFLDMHPRHAVIGTPAQVTRALKELVDRFALDELAIVSITYDFNARRRSYELIAAAWARGS